MIREAVAKVKDAVATKDVIPHMTHFYVHDGMVHATNGRLMAATPFPDPRTYLVPAEAFRKSLDRMPTDDIKIDLDKDNVLKITCERYQASIRMLVSDFVQIPRPSGTFLPVPEGFMERLRAIRPFISDNATKEYALCVLIEGDHMIATNNIAVAAAFDVGLPDMYSMLPVWAIDFVLARDTDPITIAYDAGSFSFIWEDTSWVRTQLLNVKFPEIAKTMIFDAPQPEWEIPGDWRDVYRDVSELSNSTLESTDAEIRFYADKIIGKHISGEFTASIATPVPPESPFSIWNPVFLTPVIDSSTHFETKYWPKPCPFAGPLLSGVVIGKRG
jgi:hypothetical protein